jgi:hypothetical protein
VTDALDFTRFDELVRLIQRSGSVEAIEALKELRIEHEALNDKDLALAEEEVERIMIGAGIPVPTPGS